ncbi:IS5 family transposase [Salinibacter ruber]|uniref:Transposase n=1 Tax=Salinibacter ruber TaxID=146919 RepID=A0A9X2UIQ7_9BACT|nr:IS5 family transposase [Salinibacter ruber]MCS3614201.1 putative transposase [Salinibacter ruber]MCS3672711.1 putative transposase [Salinibacter ruber]MCS3783049.1 putative transposase [Salinibacter ruber]MCS4035228.1 putative transposase [Salinibacter ruber]
MRQKRYSSDLTDSQWETIKPYFTTDRRRRHDLRRDILDAILLSPKTGCQWRMLPGEFAPWQTVYYYFRRWREEGRLQCLLSALRRTVRREEGREGEPSALIIDCQSVSTSRTGGIASYDAYKSVKGRKRHLAVDTEGLPWNVMVHAAGDYESQWAFQVLTPICGRTEQDKTVFADSAYQGLGEEVENKLGWSLSIVEREDKESGFSVDPKRWIVERTFSWLGGWRRLNRDYERNTDSSETMVRTALLRIALNRLG